VELLKPSVNPALATPERVITYSRTRIRALSSEKISAYLRTLYNSNIRRQVKIALHNIWLTRVRKSEILLAQ
jgi:UV DNA damage repair endonuclease